MAGSQSSCTHSSLCSNRRRRRLTHEPDAPDLSGGGAQPPRNLHIELGHGVGAHSGPVDALRDLRRGGGGGAPQGSERARKAQSRAGQAGRRAAPAMRCEKVLPPRQRRHRTGTAGAAHTLMVLTVSRRSAGFCTKGCSPMAPSPSHSCLCTASCRAHIASRPSSETMARASRMAYHMEVMPARRARNGGQETGRLRGHGRELQRVVDRQQAAPRAWRTR